MRLLWSGTPLERLRLWSGLVLFAFVSTHLINHAVGLWSLEAMTRVQHWRLVVTRSPPGFVLLTSALLAHAALALWKLARFRTLRLRRAELWQGLSGILIPFLLMPHLFEAGVGPRSLGVVAAYPAILPLLWPVKAVHQLMLIAVVWLHGCLGLHYWLREEGWYRAASHVLAALAALVPAAAFAGFVVAGREAARLAAASMDRPAVEAAAGLSAATREAMAAQSADATLAFYGLVALTVAVLALRLYVVRRPAEFSIVYAGGPTVRSAAGPTLLEISRAHRVPHLSVCGGKARCSTCRVRIVERGELLAPPAEAEQRLLRRIGAPPDVRLACQLRPNGPLMVALLLRPVARFIAPALASGFEAAGVDREAAVLFVDIRGFTRLSQAKLAYDIVHILNSFFAAVGQAIEATGGRVDKYIGDGLMAVFEHPTGLPGASRAAVEAVIAVDAELENVNRQLKDEIAEPLRLAMGLHGGRLVIGRIGWGAAALPTVIGPAVNIASRLESLAKSRNVELAVSSQCAAAAGLRLEGLTIDEVEIRGLEARFPVVLAARVRDLASARAGATVEPGEIKA